MACDAGTIVANLGKPKRRLLDARSPDRYRGENETLDPIGGHIPGAVNRFFKLNLDADGGFKPPSALREEFNAVIGARAPSDVIHYCGSGVTACHNLLAMEIAGLSGSQLFPGSWSEWIADRSRPVATGG
jgi:thiosulfate/3-mercaptopyruvate sulfurtransferase